MGDVKGMIDVFQKALPMDKAPELAQRLSEGKFTLRDMYEQLENLLKIGPLGKVMEMMPGMSHIMPHLKGNEGNQRIKIMLNILDSMTDEGTIDEKKKFKCLELDSNKPLKEVTRMQRIARGSGRSVKEVSDLVEQHKLFAKMVEKMKPLTKAKGNNINMAKMANAVPPQLMKQMGGVGGLSQLMKQLGGNVFVFSMLMRSRHGRNGNSWLQVSISTYCNIDSSSIKVHKRVFTASFCCHRFCS